jgi:hypothetical protein
LVLTLLWTAPGDEDSELFGSDVASAGDVNGDGFDDVLVSGPWYDGGQPREGVVSLYLGSAFGPDALPSWMFESDQPTATLGWAIASAGDVNGDGYDDVILGAKDYAAPLAYMGRVWVFLGSPTGLDPAPTWVATGGIEGAGLGTSVASAGDVNADGYDDVILGAPEWSPNSIGGEGKVYVYLGSAVGLDTVPAWVGEAAESASNYGESVASAGDVDGDGYDDIVIGAPETGLGEAYGRAYVYRGSATGPEVAASWTIDQVDHDYAYYGQSVTSAGDVNGDGYADVAIGAEMYDAVGAVFVYEGSAAGLSTVASTSIEGVSELEYFGFALASADFDADGFDDLVVGAPSYEDWTGRVDVFLGGASGLSTTVAWSISGDEVGYGLGPVGDFNGDGVDDLLIGAPHADGLFKNEGAASVYPGVCPALVTDGDGDGIDDRCDICPAADNALDADVDGIPDGCDSCPAAFDSRNIDSDLDGFGDVCDICPGFDDLVDLDANGIPDGCDAVTATYDTGEPATEGDADTDADADTDVPDPGNTDDTDVPVRDGEESPPPTAGGCGCDSAAPDRALVSWGVLLLALARRRR